MRTSARAGFATRAAALALALSGCVAPRLETGPARDAFERSEPSARRAPAAAPRPSARAVPRAAQPAEARQGDEIVVAGELWHTGVPVVLWRDPGGYDAYALEPHFSAEGPRGRRYRPGREVADPALQRRVDARAFEPAELRSVVDQLVLHYDVCGTSRVCFRVLHDQRELSVHFLIDLDGTIYQTLDVQEQAWHASKANARSVGVEIAQIGAWPADGPLDKLEEWYERGASGTRVTLPARFGDGGLRTPGYAGRPRRPQRFEGTINGVRLVQHDFTPEQYDALVALASALHAALPRIAVDAPRGRDGRVTSDVLSDAEYERFRGIVGHYHLSRAKVDPGPAFDWERFLADVRARLGPEP